LKLATFLKVAAYDGVLNHHFDDTSYHHHVHAAAGASGEAGLRIGLFHILAH